MRLRLVFRKTIFKGGYTRAHICWKPYENWSIPTIELLPFFMMRHIPYKLTRTRCDLPWLTSDIRKKIRKGNKLYRQYKRSHLPEVRCRFLRLKSDIQRQMRQSHDVYISRLITDSEDETSINPKRFWSLIKKLRKDNKETQTLKVDSNVINDSKEKAGIFIFHFESVFTNEPDEVLPDQDPSLHPQMENINTRQMLTASWGEPEHNLQ